MKRLKKINMPAMADVKLLNQYLDKNTRLHYDLLKNKFSFDSWKALSEHLLVAVQLFNRRRAGEIERVTIEDFMSYKTVNMEVDGDVYNSLSEEAKKSASRYVRFEIQGKMCRSIPVLLDMDQLKYLKLILHHREDAGVLKGNPYVFGLPGGKEKSLRACALMKKFAQLCGAKNPKSLRGTELRKHIATRSTLLNLKEQEVSDLASFLGHAEKIHKDHYRIPIITRDIVRMSRVLEMARGEHTIGDEDDPADTEGSVAQSSSVCYEKSVEQNIDMTLLENVAEEMAKIGQAQRNQDNEIVVDAVVRTRRSRSPVGHVKRTSWSNEEKNVVHKHFGKYISEKRIPSTENCFKAIREIPELQERSHLQLKAWTSNQIRKDPPEYRKRNRGTTVYWSAEERQVMLKWFSSHINRQKLPSFPECLEAIRSNTLLQSRSKETVKAWVNNEIKRRNKR